MRQFSVTALMFLGLMSLGCNKEQTKPQDKQGVNVTAPGVNIQVGKDGVDVNASGVKVVVPNK